MLSIFGNFVNHTIVLTHKYYNGVVPALENLTEADQAVVKEMNAFPEQVGTSIETYRFREALSELMNLARLGNRYLTENEPWKVFKTDPERVKTVMAFSLQIVAKSNIARAFRLSALIRDTATKLPCPKKTRISSGWYPLMPVFFNCFITLSSVGFLFCLLHRYICFY